MIDFEDLNEIKFNTEVMGGMVRLVQASSKPLTCFVKRIMGKCGRVC